MIREELKQKIEDNHNHFKEVAENYVNESWGSFLDLDYVDLVMAGIGVGKIIALEEEKRIVELKEKISNLLSCRNCPDNKGGYICQKEYEDKCLAQKIQYIKELKEENAELKEKWQENDKAWWEGFNTCKEKCGSGNVELTDNFTKATKIIKELLFIYYDPLTTESDVKHHHKILADARQFLKDSEVH